MTKRNAEAWASFVDLDVCGRDLDTMGGYPLALRLEAVQRACDRSSDPIGQEWRVKEIDRIMAGYRRKEARERRAREK